MTAKQKVAFVKNRITEEYEISPSGRFYIDLFTLADVEANGGIPDEAPILITKREQWSIIQKLEEEGFIENVELDEKKQRVWLEVVKKKIRRSNLLSHIKITDEFLQNRELFEKFMRIIDVHSLKPRHSYIIPTEEANDDLVQLLIDLKLVEYDWDKTKKQTHRDVGNRIIEFKLDSDKALALYGRTSGKNSRIKKQALELIAKDIGERFTFNKIVEIFVDLGVPEGMFIHETKWRAVFYVLSYYASSKLNKEYWKSLKIIQEMLHALMFEGNEEKAKETRAKYNKWLKYDRIRDCCPIVDNSTV